MLYQIVTLFKKTGTSSPSYVLDESSGATTTGFNQWIDAQMKQFRYYIIDFSVVHRMKGSGSFMPTTMRY